MNQTSSTKEKEEKAIPWNRYPRPQMRREEWLCLNGEWKVKTGEKTGSIRVPFCPESRLSGFDGTVQYGRRMVYRRFFSIPDSWQGRRILLHFGAVSRKAVVRINGKTAASHENGYLPFNAEITELLCPGKNELTVTVVNDLSTKYPWGKQREKRGGMWYTPVSGIWQTVWLEPVPERYIRKLTIRTDLSHAEISVEGEGVSEGTLLLEGQSYPLQNGEARIELTDPRVWSPEHPELYSFTVMAGDDVVESYFALRRLDIRKIDGIPRLCLNGKPYFFHGLLDQGYWDDGLYTPPGPEAFEQDILSMKALGFNTLRKHLKIEPEQYYYDCDRLGMIVFQDMVNNGDYRYLRDTIFPTIGMKQRKDHFMHRDAETREIFLSSMDETVRLLSSHPCICLWTIFNEGWGQFCADEAYDRLKSIDGSRFIDAASGWFRQKKSDVESLHLYFEKLHTGKEDKPQLFSEIGGWSLKIPGHSFNSKKTYGYRKYQDRETFVNDLRNFYLQEVLPWIGKGLCGTIYTQLSDIEDETNGIVTYDRKVQKLLPEEFADVSALLKI